MQIIIATDKFKGSLSAAESCSIIAEAIHRLHPEHKLLQFPLADGGEGTLDAFIISSKGKAIEANVSDPFFRKIKSRFGISSDGKQAFIEMALASGLMLLDKNDRNTISASTYGTGELLKLALAEKPDEIIVGIGGSASTDGGIGLASALGYKFYNAKGRSLQPVGRNLKDICSIDTAKKIRLPSELKIIAASDVTNPLFGPNGASCIFAPQKGASTDEVKLLDEGLFTLDQVVKKELGLDYASLSGSGAAGGLGYGMMVFCNATIQSGIELVMEACRIEAAITNSQLIITGEGKIDTQTIHGKAVSGICRMAEKYDVPVLAYTGIADDIPMVLDKLKIQSIYTLTDKNTSPEISMREAGKRLFNKVCSTITAELEKLE
jgi:glycerate 2-kinase